VLEGAGGEPLERQLAEHVFAAADMRQISLSAEARGPVDGPSGEHRRRPGRPRARRKRGVVSLGPLHYLDQVAGMYVLTTVYTCLESDERRGVCIRYGAMQSRHFDTRVIADPDAVFEALRDDSDPGFCDHSFINIQEAQRR